jgi:hypothetical protein
MAAFFLTRISTVILKIAFCQLAVQKKTDNQILQPTNKLMNTIKHFFRALCNIFMFLYTR